MKLWTGAVIFYALLEVSSGDNGSVSPQPTNKTIAHGRASVSAGSCQDPPNTVTIPSGDYADFTSPNYPNDYPPFHQCSWEFETDADHRLFLYCYKVYLSWFAVLYAIDTDTNTREQEGCFFCGPAETFQYTTSSNTATVGLENKFWFSNKGFSCRITSIGAPDNDGCNCGVIESKRIVGGEETEPNEYPWMALLVRPGGSSNFCGGSLITDAFVLTAAHCANGNSPSTIQVRLGIHDKFTDPSGSLRRNVLQIIEHPWYSDSNNAYDASLLRINAVDFSSHPTIRPICLPSGSDTYTGQQAVTAGWGTTAAGGSTSPVLLDVTVPVISNSACNRFLGNVITDSMVCAGSTGLDSCQGDSGGPLFISEGTGYQVVIGIVSWGFGCGDIRSPGVYSRVTAFRSWIDSTIADSTVCQPPA